MKCPQCSMALPSKFSYAACYKRYECPYCCVCIKATEESINKVTKTTFIGGLLLGIPCAVLGLNYYMGGGDWKPLIIGFILVLFGVHVSSGIYAKSNLVFKLDT